MSIFPTKILLATDGSEEAILAAKTAADIAQQTGSELHVVHARLTLPWTTGYYSATEPPTTSINSQEEARQRVVQWLDDQVERIEAQGGSVTQAHLRLGRPDERAITVAEQIVSLAEEIRAGLIVIGGRGLGSIRRALMGSVSDSVVRHAHCPVLVVRKEKDQAALSEFLRPDTLEA
jgi:nucleotide-binding universal stress UspA family protein